MSGPRLPRPPEERVSPFEEPVYTRVESKGGIVRYLRLDELADTVLDYIDYRIAATKCFFSGPRVGHKFSHLDCENCEKTRPLF